MAIPLSGQFNYTVVIHRVADGAWSGRAEDTSGASHPGRVGNRPQLEIVGGVLRLNATEGALSAASTPHERQWKPRNVALPIGHLERLLTDGDRLVLRCGGTADVAVTVHRENEPIAGFGAVVGEFASTVFIEDDPRVYEEHLYHIKHQLMDPTTDCDWLDIRDPSVQNWRPHPARAGVMRRVVAIAGGTLEDRARFNHQIADRMMRAGGSPWSLVDIDERFGTESAWREYLRSLPDTRPADVFVRFTINGQSVDLTEGAYETRSPWQLYVHKVFQSGLPGELSVVGIVHELLGLGRSEIIDTVTAIARH